MKLHEISSELNFNMTETLLEAGFSIESAEYLSEIQSVDDFICALSRKRSTLLDEIHVNEKRISLIDYICCKIKKDDSYSNLRL